MGEAECKWFHFYSRGRAHRPQFEAHRFSQFQWPGIQPTEDPRYFVGASYKDSPGGERVYICSTKSLEKIASVGNVGRLRFNSGGAWDGYIGNESRMRFLPKQGLLATLPEGDRQIRVIPADLPTLLKEKGEGYLHITSVPAEVAIVGKPYTYQMETLSNLPSISYSVESGPDGMKVDKQGKVEWSPKTRTKGGVERVVIAARAESGKEVFQSFTISVERGDIRSSAVETEKTPPSPRKDKANTRKPAAPNRIALLPCPPSRMSKMNLRTKRPATHSRSGSMITAWNCRAVITY